MNAFLECLAKTSAVTLIVWIVTLLLRRQSAALRHWLWLCSLAAFLLIPALLPLARRSTPVRLSLPVPAALTLIRSEVTADRAPIPTGQQSQPSNAALRIQPFSLLAGLWIAGSTILCIRRLRAVLRMRGIVRRSVLAPLPSRIANSAPAIRFSNEIRTPLAWGFLQPLILLPPEALAWTPECLHGVLEHECEHLRRLDWLSHWFAELVCAVWWFHPLVWLARSRAAHERECACDDAVLRSGVRPADYAAELLNLIKTLRVKGEPIMELSALSNVERRIKHLLQTGTDRRPAQAKVRLAVALAAVVMIVPIAMVRAQAPAGQGDLSGIVADISGARIPNAIVIASGSSGNREVTRTDASGAWSLSGIPAGNYTVEVKARGFALGARPIALSPGQRAVMEQTLSLGTVQETIDVVAQGQARPSTATAGSNPQRIRVGGNVQATKLLKQVKPAYPDTARAQGIEGTVLLNAVIAKDGSLLSLVVMNRLADPELAAAALDAVRQWRYQPTLLNGEPVEVVTTITVNFHLQM